MALTPPRMRPLATPLSAALAAAVVVAGGLLLGGGCRSLTTGTEGNLLFSYHADDVLRDFNKPIAVGAKLELKVQEAGTRRTVELLSVTSDNPSLEIVSFSGDSFIVRGASDGNALIEVEAKVPSGATVTDSVNMTVRVPDVLKLNHTCTSDRVGLYLAGQEVFIPYELKRTNGQDVIGYGYWPVTATPADGVALDQTWTGTQFMRMTTAATPGTVTLASDIDATTLEMTLVTPGDIDGADFWSGDPLPTVVGVKGSYWVLPKVGDHLVCQARTTVTVASTTPDICDVTLGGADVLPPAGGPKSESAWVLVDGKKVGVCEFDVTHLAGAGGAGQTTHLSVDVVEVQTPE